MTTTTLDTRAALTKPTGLRRRIIDNFATVLVYIALLLALAPLVAVIGFTVARGLKRFSWSFITHTMAGVGPLAPGGGVYHAIIGTLEQVLLASVIAVPLGILVAIYVTEYGGNVLAGAIRFLIDVMTGIPSIVAGLFIFAFWVIGLHKGFSGFAAALSLAILMLPIVTRATEEMLKIVPRALREASLALGVPRWRTVWSVVLPTAGAGITTGVMLAIARVTGETAPVLLTAGGNSFVNNNAFHGPQGSLPLFVFDQAGRAFNVNLDRAWAAAFTLIVIVAVLYVAARLVTLRQRVR